MNIPRSLVEIGTHFECEWAPSVTTHRSGDVIVARRIRIMCADHDRELASADVNRTGPLPSKDELDEIVLLEVARRALVESTPEKMRGLSAEQTAAAARQLLAECERQWGNPQN